MDEADRAGRPPTSYWFSSAFIRMRRFGLSSISFGTRTITPHGLWPRVPERKDDFVWENDKVAYRVYGPALQAMGEITSGIDVWSKRVPDLIVNAWYNAMRKVSARTIPAFVSQRFGAGP